MTVTFAVLISLFAEFIEVVWQYAPTLRGMLERLYIYYRKSVFLFLGMHLGYLWLLFVSLAFDLFNWPMIVAISLKTLDIFSKLDLIKRLFIQADSKTETELAPLLDRSIPVWIYAVGPLTYPYLIWLSFEMKGI